MNNKIYIASGLKNYQKVLDLRDKFGEYGVWLTYDWADAYKKHIDSQVSEDLGVIAADDYRGVLDCHLLLLLCPAGRGSHFELGVAYANHKSIVILQDEHYEPIAFYSLPQIEIYRSEELAVKRVLEMMR